VVVVVCGRVVPVVDGVDVVVVLDWPGPIGGSCAFAVTAPVPNSTADASATTTAARQRDPQDMQERVRRRARRFLPR
jgi:hypothetical protein